MKFNPTTAVAAYLLLGILPSVFGGEDGPIKLQKTESVERDILRDSQLSISPTPGRTSPIRPPTPRPTRSPTTRLLSTETERDLGSREQEDLWRHILRDSQLSISPTPGPTRPIRPTFPLTDKQTTLPPVVPDDEECELEVSKLIISNTCN
jgi:hypothetical protein